MSAGGWRTELARVLAVLMGGGIVGWVGGSVSGALLAGVGGLALWHARQLWCLQGWLRAGAKRKAAPRVAGIWGEIVDDIMRRHERNLKRRKRLTAMLERFQRSTEALPDGTVVLGENLEIEWANSAARTLLGIDNPRDQGTRIEHLVRDPDFRGYLRAGDPADSVDIASPVLAGTELNVRVIPYGEGQYLLMARDVSNLRRLETVRRDFVANVSHELRTPLTVIKGYAEGSGGENLPVEVQEALEAISRQTVRMQAIVDDLLALSRLELEPVDLASAEWVVVAELLGGLVSDAERLSGERAHRISLQADANLGLRAVGSELSSAFSNLINNAVQHTPRGTSIEVCWQAANGGAGALLTVVDDGPGIDPEDLPRITERFYRADPGRSRARGGTGLGLALVKHAVARNGGQLDIDSTPGKGARFRCHFPSERVIDFSAQIDGPTRNGVIE